MIEMFEILVLLKQVGLALAGASSLWGLYFYYKQSKAKGEEKTVLMNIADRTLVTLGISMLLIIAAWIGFSIFTSYSVLAHEGITLERGIEESITALGVMDPLFLALLLIFISGIFYRHYDRRSFQKKFHWFYGLVFVITSILISFNFWAGSLTTKQLFFIGHDWHSILTLGTVLVLDSLLMLSIRSKTDRKYFYPHLPSFSKVIFLGLTIEFISVFLIFDHAVSDTSRFRFMQTVIGIIIINGVFLSGPITNRMINSVKGRSGDISRNWQMAAAISGSISIVSWITITVVDTLKSIDLSYQAFAVLYVVFIAVCFSGYRIMEHYKIGNHI